MARIQLLLFSLLFFSPLTTLCLTDVTESQRISELLGRNTYLEETLANTLSECNDLQENYNKILLEVDELKKNLVDSEMKQTLEIMTLTQEISQLEGRIRSETSASEKKKLENELKMKKEQFNLKKKDSKDPDLDKILMIISKLEELRRLQIQAPKEDTLHQIRAKKEEVLGLISGLDNSNLVKFVWFRYKAVINVGGSEANNSVPIIFTDVTVDQWDFSMTSLFNELRTKIMTNAGMSRWSLSTIKSEVTNVINSPSIPYTGEIPGGVKPEMAFYFQGVVLTEGHYFGIYLSSGTLEADDVIFYMLCNYNETFLAYKIRRNGAWEELEHRSGCPIPKGSAFDIFIVTKTEGYEVYINGQKDYMLNHIVPMDRVNTLYIKGDIIMNIIGTVPNWSTSTFGKELNSGISRTKTSNIQSDVPHPVCSPIKEYLGEIPGGLRPGLALFFQGVVPSDSIRFDLNLMTGPTADHDIAFHFNPRMGSVVLNSWRKNVGWETEEIIRGGPFVRGGAFDIIMVITTEGYKVLVNGMEFYTFKHRVPVEKVTTLNIASDVFMNTFGIIEVVNYVHVKVTIPANI